MKTKKEKFLLLFVFLICSLGISNTTDPPEPTYSSTNTELSPCGADDGGSQPPPPGLCLPINDYLVPMLVGGILLGAYKMKELKKKLATAA